MKGETEGDTAVSHAKKKVSTNEDVDMESDSEQVNGDVSSQDDSPKQQKVVNGSTGESKMEVDPLEIENNQDSSTSLAQPKANSEKDNGDPLSSKAEDVDPLSSKAEDVDPLSSKAEDEDPLSSKAEDEDPLSSKADDKDPLSSKAEDEDPLSSKAEDEDPLSSKVEDEDPLSSKAEDEDPLSSKVEDEDDPLSGESKGNSEESSKNNKPSGESSDKGKTSEESSDKNTEESCDKDESSGLSSKNSRSNDTPSSTKNEKKRKHEEISLDDESGPKNEDPLGGDPLADPLGDPLASDDSSTTSTKSSLRRMRKEEPTLVIIDTSSIVSGKGPVAVSQPSPQTWPPNKRQATGASNASTSTVKSTVTPKVSAAVKPQTTTKPASVKPSPASAKSSPRPSPSSTPTPPTQRQQPVRSSSAAAATPQPVTPQQQFPRNPEIDDSTFVVEAPSFVVPYVYEKESTDRLKQYIEKLKDMNKEAEEKRAKEKAEQENSKEGDDKMETNEDGKPKSELEKRLTEGKDDAEVKEDKTSKPPTLPTGKITDSYFESPLGKMFMDVGINLVQEFVQTDLLKIQKKKADKEGGKGSAATQHAVRSLLKNLETSKENNEPFHFAGQKCSFCSFRSESRLAMALHMEVPHMLNYMYKCNFCKYETRAPQEILFHSEAEHNVRGRLERSPLFHQCPLCPFEDNQKGKVTRHIMSCQKRYRADRNQDPSFDWDTPAKLKKRDPLARGRTPNPLQAASRMHPLLPKMGGVPPLTMGAAASIRGRGRPVGSYKPDPRALAAMRPGFSPLMRPVRPSTSPLLAGVVGSRLGRPGAPLYQMVSTTSGPNKVSIIETNAATKVPTVASSVTVTRTSANKTPTLPPSLSIQIGKGNDKSTVLQRGKADAPSISITPLPRQSKPPTPTIKPGQAPSSAQQKTTFVICEICDGYIKDLEQLRNHMQWIHKVKIHPKMIASRPPLNCQKCQYRFFTDQGLERHLLGTHGLVTSSMQEAANKGQDAGRCPICGKVYQWKLLNHVSREHRLTLKPAHLSYKCTVCTATFSMYKQFENHVYSAHSMVAKKVLDGPRANKSEDSAFKINNEITIIPQPANKDNKKNAGKKEG